MRESGFNEEEIAEVKEDVGYHDMYILIKAGENIGFLSVLEQKFEDPYLEVVLDSCDLINYKGRVPVNCFLEVMDNIFRGPQITVAKIKELETFERYGFYKVEEKPRYPGASRLIPVYFKLPLDSRDIKNQLGIRPMEQEDLEGIANLFFEEYAARYRLVGKMYETDPESCFVYEEDGEVKGVVFSERRGNELYVRQMFVKRSGRGSGIDTALFKGLQLYAEENKCSIIRGSIRGNLVRYYEKKGVRIDSLREDRVYVIRFNKNR